MNKTTLEINKEISKILGITNWCVSPSAHFNDTDKWIYSEDFQGDTLDLCDYCNNWTDAVPMINKASKHGVSFVMDNYGSYDIKIGSHDYKCENLLKGIAIILIEINGE